jgi:hypothetical protein
MSPRPPVAITGVWMEDSSNHSKRSDAGSGDDNRTTVMNNRRSNNSSHRLMDLYMSQMPPSLVNETMVTRNRDDRSASTGSWSSVATPPPPTTAPPKRSGLLSVFRTLEDNFQDELEQQRMTDHPRGAWIIERADSVESVDESEWPSHWNSFFQRSSSDPATQRSSGRTVRRSCAWVLVASLLVLCGIVGLSVGLTASNESEQKARSSDLSAVDEGTVETASPTLSPSTRTPVTPAPTVLLAVTTAMPTPQKSCQDSVEVDRRCYNVRDLETVAYQTSFISCEPHPENWIGVFPAGHDAERLPDPLLWLWTCNSQNVTDCDNEGTPSGVLGIGGVLKPGRYQAALVAHDGIAPFSSAVISPVFEIREKC